MPRTISHTTAGVLAAALAMTVVGVQYAVNPPDGDALREVLVVAALIAGAGALVFGVVIPRAVARGTSARTALTLSLFGLLLAIGWWTGIPPVLALGGIVLAGRVTDPAQEGLARTATAIGVLALVADLALMVVGGILE
jgi:hypothetical protein